MTKEEFLKSVAGMNSDVLGQLLATLEETHTAYCVIGGLAVNAYVEPVVSLDLDMVIEAGKRQQLAGRVSHFGPVRHFEHRINWEPAGSDLRIQFQLDLRYQDFLERIVRREVLGYEMNVASVEDVLSGKIWAFLDRERRPSKRQKDLADIARIIEEFPQLKETLPSGVRDSLQT